MSTVNYAEEAQVFERVTITWALMQLTTKQRATLALRSAGYTQEECGVIFGMTRANIGFIERKAHLRLRESLLEKPNGTT